MKPKCTIKNPQCAACRAAVGRKRGPVSVTDMDADARRWRAAGPRAVKRLLAARRDQL